MMRTGARVTILALVFFLCPAGCKKEVAPPDAWVPAVDDASVPVVVTDAAPAPRSRVEHPHVEAIRAVVGKDDAWLAPHADVLKAHFNGTIPAKMSVQKVEAGRRFVLIEGDNPLFLVIEEDGKLAWKKDRPAAGIAAPVGPMAIASGPKGLTAIAICDPPTKWIALRLVDEEGFPFADLQALEGPCESIGLLYWPHHGWIVTSAKANELTRAQLITEDAKLAWEKGRTFGARWRSLGAPSLAADAKGSFLWVQMAGIESDPDQILAYRYDAEGKSLFAKALDLGKTKTRERLVLERRSEGVVHVAQAKADILSSGEVRR